MKHIIVTIIFAIVAFSFAEANNTNPSFNEGQEIAPLGCKNKVKLSASTLVILEVNETKFGDRVTIGQNVHCRVRNNVYAEGEVVIRTGSMALGRIKGIEESTTNGEMLILVEMFYVQAVDGQQVALNGNEQTVMARNTNEVTNVNPMLTITAQIMDNTIVIVD